MSKGWKFALLAGAALAPATALAQTEPVQTSEEIIVTAERRAERLEDVPISVTSLSSELLDQSAVSGLFELNQVAPGVRVDHYGAYSQPTIRGIGTQDVQGPGANANVAIYIDGFYMPSQAGNIFDLANIAQVDVLRGPQGTLFGQNATGGAILVTTRDPSHDSHAQVSIGAGSFNDRRALFYGTTGLSDTIATDLSVYYRESDSYFDDIATGEPTAPIDQLLLRSKTLWELSDSARLTLILEYSDVNDPSGLTEITVNPITQFYNDNFGVPIINTLEPYETSLNFQSRANPVTYAGALKAEFDLGEMTFTSYTQYRDQDAEIAADLDGTTVQYWHVQYTETEETFTQEFNLTSTSEGPLDWVMGAFYYHDVGALTNNAFNDVFNTGTPSNWLYSDAEVETDSIAAFVDGTYQFGDRWWLTLGARYTVEEKTLHSENLLPPFQLFDDSTEWESFTPRAAIRYALSDDANIYASVARGFMSGNYGYTTVGPQEAVDPEEVTQYEAGYKIARPGWSFETAAFFSDYTDLQVVVFDSGCGCFHVDNAPQAETYGAEAHLFARVTDQLSINTGVSYTHAQYEEYVGAGAPGTPYIPPNYGYATAAEDFAGNQMIRAPEWTANVGVNYTNPLANGELALSGNVYYTSDTPLTPDNRLEQEAYTLLALRAAWTDPSARFTFSVFGNNVTDEQFQVFSWAGFLGNNIVYGPPANWGARIDMRF